MGNGISSLHRLRKLILMRAYNRREKDETILEQLLSISHKDLKTDKTCINSRMLATMLEVNLESLKPLPDVISVELLMCFLETGKLCNEKDSTCNIPSNLQEKSQKERQLSLIPAATTLPQLPVWKKREIIFQEHIVEYTTIDVNGSCQKLVETETTESEVNHMECKQTGEFCHKETKRFSLTETFNNEVVAEEDGDEQYLHMKSKHDEIETYVNNMPAGRRADCRQPKEEENSPNRTETTPDGRETPAPNRSETEKGQESGPEGVHCHQAVVTGNDEVVASAHEADKQQQAEEATAVSPGIANPDDEEVPTISLPGADICDMNDID